MALPIAIITILIFSLWWIAYQLYKDWYRAGWVTFLGLFWAAYYGTFYVYIKAQFGFEFEIGHHLILVIVWLIPFLIQEAVGFGRELGSASWPMDFVLIFLMVLLVFGWVNRYRI